MTHILTIHNYSTRAIEFLFEVYNSYLFSKKVKQDVAELSRLSDKELNDIGMTRGEIYSVVLQGIKRDQGWV